MPLTLDSVQCKLQQYESLAISQSSVMKTSGKQLHSGVQDVAMVVQHGKNNNQKGSANRSSQQTQSSKSTTKKEPLTEERAKSLGLKKLSCCGKFGSHKPSECRNPTKKQDSINNQPSVHIATESSKSSYKSKSKEDASDVAAAVALKGPAFYEDDNDFTSDYFHHQYGIFRGLYHYRINRLSHCSSSFQHIVNYSLPRYWRLQQRSTSRISNCLQRR